METARLPHDSRRKIALSLTTGWSVVGVSPGCTRPNWRRGPCACTASTIPHLLRFVSHESCPGTWLFDPAPPCWCEKLFHIDRPNRREQSHNSLYPPLFRTAASQIRCKEKSQHEASQYFVVCFRSRVPRNLRLVGAGSKKIYHPRP